MPFNESHYNGDLVMRLIEFFNLNFNLGNALKYILRAGRKEYPGLSKRESAIKDLGKALDYLERQVSHGYEVTPVNKRATYRPLYPNEAIHAFNIESADLKRVVTILCATDIYFVTQNILAQHYLKLEIKRLKEKQNGLGTETNET